MCVPIRRLSTPGVTGTAVCTATGRVNYTAEIIRSNAFDRETPVKLLTVAMRFRPRSAPIVLRVYDVHMDGETRGSRVLDLYLLANVSFHQDQCASGGTRARLAGVVSAEEDGWGKKTVYLVNEGRLDVLRFEAELRGDDTGQRVSGEIELCVDKVDAY